MQEEFKPLVETVTAECSSFFGNKLVAAYLHGSIEKGDAIPGVSDLDYLIVISDQLQTNEKQWLDEKQNAWSMQYTAVDSIHLAVHSIEALKNDCFTRFALEYNATLLKGKDIALELKASGIESYEPDARFAKSRLDFAKKCFEEAISNRQPACTGEIPLDTYFAARKFARYFIVVEGAYFLMSRNMFQSFRKEDVLLGLQNSTNGYEEILGMSSAVLLDPIAAGITHDVFLRRIRPFVAWMFEEIATAK